MHTFTSNSSVTINAVNQETGVVKGEIYSASAGTMSEGEINIEVTFLNNENGNPVHHASFRVSEDDFNAFEGTITISATSTLERFEEVCARYVISQLDGQWGLTPADWTLEAH